jgi:polysaccharide biosynthesis/export protein
MATPRLKTHPNCENSFPRTIAGVNRADAAARRAAFCFSAPALSVTIGTSTRDQGAGGERAKQNVRAHLRDATDPRRALNRDRPMRFHCRPPSPRSLAPRRLSARIAAACSILLLLSPIGARAAYKLEPGDALDFSVVGVPQLKQTVRVDVDGDASFPLIGQLKVSGLTLDELRTQLQRAYPSKVLQTNNAEGQEVLVAPQAEAISLQIAEYRPVYVDGDVEHPGQQTYTPGLTVRQAIALAGGFDVMHFRMANPFMESADLRGQNETLWMEFARQQAHVLRLQAELGDTGDAWKEMSTPLPASTIASINELEAQQQKVEQDKLAKDQALLRQQIAQIDAQLEFLAQQQRNEVADLQHDLADIARTSGLVREGLETSIREAEDRHNVGETRARISDNVLQAGALAKTRSELMRSFEQMAEQRRADLLKDLEQARADLAATQAKLHSTGDKILYVGLVRSQLVRGLGSRPSVQIVRRGETIAGTEESELQPGDTVEIALDPASALHADADASPAHP